MDRYPSTPPFWQIHLNSLLRLCLIFLIGSLATTAWAEVAVLANRTVETITVEIIHSGKRPTNLTIHAGDSLPLFYQRSLQVRFGEGFQRQQFMLQAGSAYFFSRSVQDNTLALEQIGLGEQVPTPSEPTSPRLLQVSNSVTIAVKILVDKKEPTLRKIWEPKLRKRIAEASKILQQHSGIRLKVVEVATWKSEEKQQHFRHTLREFERKVKTLPGQLAIGFSSHYRASPSGSHLGVTRWPLHSHILLRERSRNLLEAEKLEVLVHELGHYLGASHSPEPQSVMRPILTRGQQRGVGSRIQFDPVNTLIVALIGEEMREHGVREIKNISKPTVERLIQIYSALQLAMPSDPAPRQYLRMLKVMSASQQVTDVPEHKKLTSPLVRDTRKVLAHLLAVAKKTWLESRPKTAQPLQAQPSGDELTNLYVRQAAQAASRLRSANAKRAMLLALGIFLDDTSLLLSYPGTGDFIGLVESEGQREVRIKVLGQPTMRERVDLTRHFFVSAHLVVVGGKQATTRAGLAKEMLDSQGGTGFSFSDIAANLAGIVFAESVLSDKLSLADLARGFHVDDYLPTLRGLEEGLSADDLKKRYSAADQTTLKDEIDQIEQRVLELPVYDRREE